MKKMKTIVALILAAVLAFGSMTVFAGESEEPMKIGVILTFTENGYGLTVKQYLDTIGEALNIEFNYAAAQEAEAMNEAMENYAAAGVKGILTMPTMNTLNEVEFCEQNGIYFTICGTVPGDDIYEQVKDNPFYGGAVGNDDAASTLGMVHVLADKYGVQKLGLISLPMGTSDMHDGRYAGVKQGVEETGIELVAEGLAYNLTESAQNMVAQYPDLDAIIALAGGIEECMQPIIAAGKQDTMKFAGFREEAGAEDLFETGALATLGVGTPINAVFAFINLYNAITGAPLYTDGACRHTLDTIYVSSADEYLTYVHGAMDQNPFTVDEIKEYLTAFNPDASKEAFEAFMDGYDLEYLATK